MPYGVDKDIGGDNKDNTQWMEQCVKKVMNSGKDKEAAIAICKTTLKKTKGNKTKSSIIISMIYDI